MISLNYIIILFILLCSSALIVILLTNPIFSILFLILTFCIGSLILFYFSLEFLGFLYLIIYVGAIAILFLFVIMLLNLNILNYLKIYDRLNFIACSGFFLILLFIFEQYLFFNLDFYYYFFEEDFYYMSWIFFLNFNSDIIIIGNLLYTDYFLSLILLTLLFFVSLIGAILLIEKVESSLIQYKNEYKKSNLIKYQDISEQVSRMIILK